MNRLTGWQRTFLYLAVALVVAGMVIGFWSSWGNLYAAAKAHGWQYPWHLPAGADVGILAYVLLDQLAVTLGAKSRWLHFVALGFAGFSVWANAAVVSESMTWRVIYGAMPAVWVIGVEALRSFWRLIRKEHKADRDHVPASRWLANPFTAAALQRRMWMLNEVSWPRMALIEDARLLARDLTRAARQVAEVTPPPMLLARIASSRLPGTVLAAVDVDMAAGTSTAEVQVHAWVRSQLTLPDRVAADLQTDRLAIAQTVPAPPPEPVPDAPSMPTPAPRPARARKPRTKTTRTGPKLTPADEARILAWLDGDRSGDEPSVGAVMAARHVGRPTARRLLDEARRPIRAVR